MSKNRITESAATVAPDYKTLITEEVQNIQNLWLLEQIHKFIINMVKEGRLYREWLD